MGFFVRNLSAGVVPLDDLGFQIEVGEDYDMLLEPPPSVRVSSLVGGDLYAAISTGDLTLLNPLNPAIQLSTVDSIAVITTGVVVGASGGGVPAWDAGKSYTPNEVVTNGAELFVALVANTNNQPTNDDGSRWRPIGRSFQDTFSVIDDQFDTFNGEWTDFANNLFPHYGTEVRISDAGSFDFNQDASPITVVAGDIIVYSDNLWAIKSSGGAVDLTPYTLTDGSKPFTGDVVGTDFIKTREGSVTRDANGLIATVAKVGGRTLTYTRGVDGRINTATDGTLTYTFNRTNGLITDWTVT